MIMSWENWSVIAMAILVLTGLVVAAIFLAYGVGFYDGTFDLWKMG